MVMPPSHKDPTHVMVVGVTLAKVLAYLEPDVHVCACAPWGRASSRAASQRPVVSAMPRGRAAEGMVLGRSVAPLRSSTAARPRANRGEAVLAVFGCVCEGRDVYGYG